MSSNEITVTITLTLANLGRSEGDQAVDELIERLSKIAGAQGVAVEVNDSRPSRKAVKSTEVQVKPSQDDPYNTSLADKLDF